MYEDHWGLREAPFRTCLAPQFFYQSPTHEEALARLHFLAGEHRRLGLLLGESGSGKSLVLEVFARELKRKGFVVAGVNLYELSPREMLWHLAASLGLNLSLDAAAPSLWGAVADRLAENRYQQLGTAVLLDDADLAAEEVLRQVARLCRLEPTADARLTFLLSARREGMARLGHALLELVELRIDLERWEPSDTEGYLRDALAKAGHAAPVFNSLAVSRIHDLAQGVPRRVSQLADLALAAGASQSRAQIDGATVDAVFTELAAVEV